MQCIFENVIIKGNIIKGHGIGRKINFPTLNIYYDGAENGVFAGKVKLDGKIYKAAVHIGRAQTLNRSDNRLEAYLIDFDQGINPGEKIEVNLINKIRETKKFDNLKQLKAQIAKDVETVKKLL